MKGMDNLGTLNAIMLTALQHTTPIRTQHIDLFVALRGVAALSILAAAWLLVVWAVGATRPPSNLTPAQDSQAAYKAAAAAWIKAKNAKS